MNLPELSAYRPNACLANPPRRLFLRSVYRTPDNALQRAAAEWEKDIKFWEGFDGS